MGPVTLELHKLGWSDFPAAGRLGVAEAAAFCVLSDWYPLGHVDA